MPTFKVFSDDIEVEYDFSLDSSPSASHLDPVSEQIRIGLDRVENEIQLVRDRVDTLDQEIDRRTSHTDRTDNLAAVGCGLLAGLVDVLWVGEWDFANGKAWSNRTANDMVMRVAKAQGYKGDRLDGAIKFLEDKFPIPNDCIWKGKDVGVSSKSHHLDDLAHHPTPVGLFFSILSQFTENGYFQNAEGTFLSIGIDENGSKLIGSDFPSKIFCGTVNWFFHLISDMSGSNKTAGVGMGIPGPIVSLLKEFSAIPGLNLTGLPRKLKQIFVAERFDLRSELAVLHEVGRQAVPVILNEVVVRAFYFIRRIVSEIKAERSFDDIDWKQTLPWNNRTIVRMLTIATGTFTAVDLADASIRAARKSGGDAAAFAVQLVLRVNFVGIGRFAIAVYTDASMGRQRREMREARIAILSEQLHLVGAKVAYLQAEGWHAAESTATSLQEIEQMMIQSTRIAVDAWEADCSSLQRIEPMLDGIEVNNPMLLLEMRRILKLG